MLLPEARSGMSEKDYCATSSTTGGNDRHSALVYPLYLGYVALVGPTGVALALAVLDVFATHANAPASPRAHWLAAQAYAVYLLHPYVVLLIAWAYMQLVAAEPVTFAQPASDSAVPVSCTDVGQLRLWLGFACTSVLSVLVVWPLAAAMRRLPGFRRVL